MRNWILFIVLVFLVAGCKKNHNQENDVLPDPEETNELPDTITIISFNILEGMKLDKQNNYANFVKWVDSLSPDVLALEEVNGFRQHSLERLAARWGHKYVLTNVKATDNYPVAITSKYPIESRRRITMDVSHGAIFAKFTEYDDLNFVVTHLWPQAYWHQQGDELGNEYRLFETKLILDSTVLKFPSEKNWLFMGDFNSRSKKDFEVPPPTNYSYAVTDYIEEQGFEDVIHYLHGYKSNESADYDFTYFTNRIDFIFGSNNILPNVIYAQPIYDDFTLQYSDHRPVICKVIIKK